MSNLGLERALAQLGIALVRTPVGDRYVLEAMRAGGFALGGEQSGHIVDLDLNTTGDGPATAVAVLSLVVESGATLRELASPLTVYPQVLLNVRTQRRDVSDAPAVRDAVAEAERALAGSGRILVRPSGTEPLVRVMVEGSDDALVRRVAGAVADVIRSSAAEAASA
jgi:phosphoglucosamine mutase